MTSPLTDQQLDEIEARAAGLYEYATGLDDAWQDEADRLSGTDVPALAAEVRRLRDASLEGEAEIAKLRDLLAKENKRANDAIDREETAEQGALEAQQERDAVRDALAREERLHGDTIDDRDHFHDMADKLAYAVAPEEVIGQHSSMNDPWRNALDLVTPKAEVDKLRQERQAVLDLHEKGEHNGLPICLHCASQMYPPPESGIWSESAYPCATLQAHGVTGDGVSEAEADGEQASTAGRAA